MVMRVPSLKKGGDSGLSLHESGCGFPVSTQSVATTTGRMRRHTCFVLLFIAATVPVYVLGYSHGRVSSACATMRPNHSGSNAQSTNLPYQIIASSSTFNPGDTIQVMLRSNPGTTFKGFLLEARAAESSSSATPLGTFTEMIADAQLLNCTVTGTTYTNSGVWQIELHSEIPFISTEKVDVTVVQLVVGDNNRSTLIKTHGALMLIAWMTVGSIGMIIAKFFKSLGGSTKILGKKIWFQLHWTLMMLTVITTIIGFVLAFVQVKGWSYSAGAHPVLGCTVMGLALIQPSVAFFRPSPDHERRFIFNIFHNFMALAIKILAVATLFLGFKLIEGTENAWMQKVLGGFVGWECLIYVLLFICCYFKEEDWYVDCQEKVEPDLVILIVYLCGNLAFLIALLVGIGQT
ncbi:putative ferric-chelate reductase 1 [Rhincodon typus]|uniref:putative ferric-chelate reductase 1 n=1 Tax=Rhincodon typus TaxID=259920 RepID=UPI00202F8086|nr:putative ferric-chelate reductase 1 [Rhincodon typus]